MTKYAVSNAYSKFYVFLSLLHALLHAERANKALKHAKNAL
jgi:hypothetical protein